MDFSNNARENIPDFLQSADLAEHVTRVVRTPAQAAKYCAFPEALHPLLAAALQRRGIQQLYSHQGEAWQKIRTGLDTVIVTPTASGKTLCYNLPVLQKRLEEPKACALYLFPTKALSQDQQAELNELLTAVDQKIVAVTYDGDTPQGARQTAREKADIIITNPDMLHAGILPNHARWSRFFSALRYLVIDEMHIYRGVFGSHVANVLRRLLRIARFYGANPQCILCSATIANPQELASALIGRPVEPVSDNGAARSERNLVLYNPPLLDPVQGIRRSTALESVRVCTRLLQQGLKTILFARSRMKVELIASYLNKQFENTYNNNFGIRVEPYRAGLLPNERRAIERGLREGSIQGVVSTNALELGIDIGGLEASVIAGWPGNVASFRQQAGRSGRRQGSSWQIFIAGSQPLDQYLLAHPERILYDSAESGQIDPDNVYIYTDHIKCAAFELPFATGESFGSDCQTVLAWLEEEGIVRRTQNRWYWSASSNPSEKISLRSASADNVVIVDETAGKTLVIGEMDRPGAKEYLYDNAVYIHRGNQYMVKRLDIENRLCHVEESDVNYFTDAVVKTDLKVLTLDMEQADKPYHLVCGDMLVRSQAEKYKKLRFETHENIGYGEIYLPPEEIQTRSLSLLLPPESQFGNYLATRPSESEKANLLAGLSVLIKTLAPLELLCDRVDLGVAWRLRDDHYNVPCVHVWDRYPGGTGLSEALMKKLPAVFTAARQLVEACTCENGCPSCIGLPDASLGLIGSRKDLIVYCLAFS